MWAAQTGNMRPLARASNVTHAHLITELVVDQRLRAERSQVHGLVEPHAVVVNVHLWTTRPQRRPKGTKHTKRGGFDQVMNLEKMKTQLGE